MQIKQLEVFVHVARLKSFSKAADALYLTQPTISAHISSLENELGTKLVIRSTKEIQLTTTGSILLGYATQILGLCERAEQEVKTASSDIQGALSVAASTVPSQYLLPRILPSLRKRYPKVFFQIYQGDTNQVAQRVFENGAELGIIGSPVQKAGCVCTPFFSERMVIATPNTQEYQELDGVMTTQALRSSPFLVREPGSGTRRRGEEFLRGIGIDPRDLVLAAQLQSTESILQGVKNGLGIAIVSGLAAVDYTEMGKILTFDFDSPLLTRQFYLIHHRTRPHSPAATMLLQELPQFFHDGALQTEQA
ncbi:selenium metabolism-associated LysR family transcriptional regulator [Pseudoflavonifractor sp. MSJ-37]|uniref:selenium metabolism-associated LysR family transcriptional regulator n=1 Tax=Pseudoflavonifractor sp. MSJ-37 TaxID=2841531 RepID=UPI001C102298|nr:selenium metabolism-associated LysR family transcriptional regulator [Pseudoflavonifractor sp. MSJ-37]MBU5435315.1 LysR family transcriptional regulator [Pseudoflavonifractor sp. MSJ-37]